ncbi:MAG: S41 family peptidase [Phycisphaerales bacterium]
MIDRSSTNVVAALSLVLCVGSALPAQVVPSAGMLRFPDVSADRICFVYANNIWTVGRDGGTAQPVAAPPGAEAFPRFSPDGSRIAFVGNYEGNTDLYTIPVAGGIPSRVTHHPSGEILCDWSPDGASLMYLSNGLSGLSRQSKLYTVPATGGMFEPLPLPYAGFGSVSPDGQWLAYTPHSTDTRTWKRYRGGMATDIWLFNLKDKSSRKITDWEGTDTLPMWVPGGDGSTVYYLCDSGPEHRLNIHAFDVKTGTSRAVTSFKEDDVRWPSIGPGTGGKGEIVFQLGSRLMLLDLSSGAAREVKVTIPGDRPKLKPRAVDAARNIERAAISPSAKRVALEARGELWSAPAKEGVVRNLTRTDGVAERAPAWSPDGKWIAYFSDESGENELFVRASDARPEEAKADDTKADDKKDERKETSAAGDARAATLPRKLTNLGAGFRFGIRWSPDSKRLTFTDEAGRLMLTTLETGETKQIDQDGWSEPLSPSWSHDSNYLAYSRADDATNNGVVMLVDVRSGERTALTSPMFSADGCTFDRKGDWMFISSTRAINNPEYSDIDGTFAYRDSQVLLMVPLRNDVKSPWLATSDEEKLKKDEPASKDKGDEKKTDEKKADDKKGDDKDPADGKEKKPETAKAADDGVSGTYNGKVEGNVEGFPANGLPIAMTLRVSADGSVSGKISSLMGSGPLTGTYDKASGELNVTVSVGRGSVTLKGSVKDGQASGTWSLGEQSGNWSANRTAPAENDDKEASGQGGDKPAAKGGKSEKTKELKIDIEGFEARAIQLPITPGGFGDLAVADGEKLIFARRSSRAGGESGIRIYDYKADEKSEKSVAAGGGFEMSADGKKLLVGRGASLSIVDASAGGKSQAVPTGGMRLMVDPRTEWRQVFVDAWRIMRDYFYEPTMHGVDWSAVREHYARMIDDASTREDVNWIISEMISELNIGHAYLQGTGDVEDAPATGVGLLGCDFELDRSGAAPAYRIRQIITGGAWDADVRSPLQQPGLSVKAGEYLLAVNGVPVDTSKDPYAALIGLAERVTSITISSNPVLDGTEREVLVKPIGSETDVRYRAYIEAKRQYVDAKSGGKIGYIYVQNTGVPGQNDLYRQFYGQFARPALLIDERWNGGGQIPNRFIELLDRPVTNYWARRHGQDWTEPRRAHNGPKAMLVNGLAGSGGDMFPWLFKHHKIGKVFGTRTWGGLVGISGYPRMIDGGSITSPSFAFYETDGTWGVEGHGVDPDVVVIDDPAKMQEGGDPQLDAAIAHLLEEVATKPYVRPKRPESPDRRGMGIPKRDW